MVVDAPYRGAYQSLGFIGGCLTIFRHPGAMLSNISMLKEITVQTSAFNNLAEGALVHQWGAGSHHYPIESLLLYILPDKLLPWVRAHILIGVGNSNKRQLPGKLSNCFYIYCWRDIGSAVTDIDANFRLHFTLLCLPCVQWGMQKNTVCSTKIILTYENAVVKKNTSVSIK